MSDLTASLAKGRALFVTNTPRVHADDADNKVAGVYSHVNLRASGTEADENASLKMFIANQMKLMNVQPLCINGAMRYFQRQTPGTLTTCNDAAFGGPDGWKMLCESASMQFKRITGDTYGQFACEVKNNSGGAKGGGIAQAIKACKVIPLAGKEVTLSARVRCSEANNIYFAIASWTSTADAPTSDPISSWTSPLTYVANYTENANLTTALLANTWTDISLTATLSAGATNVALIMVIVGTGSGGAGLSNNALVDFSQVWFGAGEIAPTWQAVAEDQDLANCRHHYAKSFAVDVAPVQNSGTEVGALHYYCMRAAATVNGAQLRFPVTMHAAPTMTYYSPGAASTAWYNYSGAAASGASSSQGLSDSGVCVENAQAAGDALSNRLAIHWSAAAEIW